MQEIERGDLLYANPLAAEGDLAGFRLEGEAVLSFPAGRLRMQNALDPALGQRSNFVLWCPEEFPPDVAISWEFHPIAEPGLCMFFFATRGRRGEDLFDPALAPRHGIYDQYHHGDLDGYHVSYFRRRVPEGRAFHVCNLRKSYGFHLAAQGPDPCPASPTPRRPITCAWTTSAPRFAFPSTACPSCGSSTMARGTGHSWAGARSAFGRWRPSSASTPTCRCTGRGICVDACAHRGRAAEVR